MNARIALPLLTLVTALSSLPPVECKAASMSMSGGIAGDVTVASSSDFCTETASTPIRAASLNRFIRN